MKEAQHIEWKESWRDEYLKWISGFANAFFRTGLIESWGRGIERIVAACANAGLPAPTFQCEVAGLWTVLHFADNYTEATTQETTQEKILALLRTEPSITRRELADRLGITTDGVKYHLQKMSADGIVRHVDPTKSGHWEVLK